MMTYNIPAALTSYSLPPANIEATVRSNLQTDANKLLT